MSKLAEIIQAAAESDIRKRDKNKIIKEDKIKTIVKLVEYELNLMTGDLSGIFTPEEQVGIDILELEILVCNGMIKMCQKIMELKKKDPEEYKKLSSDNLSETKVQLAELVKSLLPNGLEGLDGLGLKSELKDKIASFVKKQANHDYGIPDMPGAPVFAMPKADDKTLN